MDEKIKKEVTQEKKAPAKRKPAQKREPEVKDAVVEPIKKAPVELDPHMYVEVRNGFAGTLIYKSKKTGEEYIFEQLGDVQEIELQELKSAKVTAKQYFANNWFLIEDQDVIDYLGVGEFYKDSLKYDEYYSLFKMRPDDLIDRIRTISDGQKKSIAYLAMNMCNAGRIDSNRVIHALEDELNIHLTER